MDMAAGSGNYGIDDFSGFPKVKSRRLIQKEIKRIFRSFRSLSFSFSKLATSEYSRFPNMFLKNASGSFFILLECLGVSKIKNDGFGESWTRPLRPKTMKMKTFRGFPK